MNENRVAAYRRLMRAEELIANARVRHGAAWSTVEEALTRSEPTDDEPDLFLTTLARFVAELGGHIEVRAVFADETIVVHDEAGPR